MEYSLVKLENIATVKSGKRLPKGHVLTKEKTDYPYIRLVDIEDNRVSNKNLQFLEKDTHEKISNYIVEEGNVCLAVVGHTIGLVFYIDKDFDGNNLTENAVRLIVNNNVNSKYVYYYLLSKLGQDQIISRKVGSAQGKLPIYGIKGIEIVLPSINTQNKVVQILDSIDEKYRINKKIISNLEIITEQVFKRWFIDFEFPNEQGLPYRSSGGEMVESELGNIPGNWKVGTLEDHLYLHYGKALTKKDRVEGEIPVYGSGGVTGSHNKAIVKGPGIILGRKGSIGTIYYEMKDFYPIDTVFYIESKKHSMNYLLNLLKTYDFTKSNNDSAVPGLNRNLVYNTKTFLPLDSIVQKFEEIIAPMNQMIFDLKEENVKLEELRDNLLPKLLAGEIELPDESVVEPS